MENTQNETEVGGCPAAPCSAVERHYVADIVPDPDYDDMPIEFYVIFDPKNEDQPWMVSSDIGCETHQSLDEVLFWELIVGERHISEKLRRQIAADFQANEPEQTRRALG